MSVRTVKLTMINDLVCGWCYIGQRELDVAIEQAKAQGLPLRFELEYKPFQINRVLPEDTSVSLEEHYSSRFGKQRWEQMKQTVYARAMHNGIDFKFTGKISQTTRAHRLVLKAGQVGGPTLQREVLELLYTTLFGQGGDIGDDAVLASIAEEAGVMSEEEALDFLKSKECHSEVTGMIQEAVNNGVTGVPATLIDNQFLISGSHTADVYLQIFQKLAACHRAGQAGCPNGATKKSSCSIPATPAAPAAIRA